MYSKQIMGVGLIAAIFFLVVLSTAALFLHNQMSDSQQIGNYEVTMSRAYYAAYSGLEWGIYSSLNAIACGTIDSPTILDTFSDYNITLNVSCTTNDYIEGGSTIHLTTILSKAAFGVYPSLDYVQKQMTVTIQH